MADIIASNGVIHTISRLLYPPPKFEAVEAALAVDAAVPAKGAKKPKKGAKKPKKKSAKKPKLTIGFKKNDD